MGKNVDINTNTNVNTSIIENIKDGIYIPSIEACWLYKLNEEIGNYEVNYKYLDKLLNGKLDFSFELAENISLVNNITIKEFDGGKKYTLDIINVKYTKKYKKIVDKKVIEEKTTKELRDWTYINGFKFNNNLMSNWKRSTGKARKDGQNLFILDSIRDECLNWARMGLTFEGEQDIASVRAYESLPLSSIIGIIEGINPNYILVIDDYDSIFDWTVSKTWLENKELKTETVKTEEKNSIWDGLGLMSKEIFDSNKIIKGKGFALLRNRYMKCAAFNCNLSQYYKDYCKKHGYDYDTFEVEDIYGNAIKVKNIQLITTPSSLKIEKFKDNKVLKEECYAKLGDGAWLQYWKSNCGSRFGVCEVEVPSKFDNGKLNRLSYQMINTIPFTKQEVKELIKPEIKYVERLKNDLNFFLQEVNAENDIDTDVDIDIIENNDDNELEVGQNIDVTGAFTEMVKKNPDFANTQVFKDYRRNFINAYVNQLRQGKIRIEADYCVACGNPLEMLKATTGDFDGTSVLQGNELYCSRFKDGEDVIGFRNPHVNVGNIGIQVNKFIKEINDYFNCTPNIVFLNSIDYPTLSTYQGEDFDSDCNLLSNNPILIKACKKIDKNKTPIPVNAVANSGSNNAELTGQNMSDIDHTISENYIGSVINLSQEINSLINHLKYNNLATDVELGDLYKRTSRLSSISCVEIDKAKRQFKDLNIPCELGKMKDGLALTNDGRRIKPYFFKFIGDNEAKKKRKLNEKKHREELDRLILKQFAKDNNILIDEVDKKDKRIVELLKQNDKIQQAWIDEMYVKMDTPMDWLQSELDKIKNSKKIGTVQVIYLIKKIKHKADSKIVSSVIKIIKDLDTKIKAYKLNPDLTSREKLKKIRYAKYKASKKIREKKLTKANMYGVLKMCLNTCKKNGKINKKSGIESITLEVLFKAYGTGLLDMFLQNVK